MKLKSNHFHLITIATALLEEQPILFRSHYTNKQYIQRVHCPSVPNNFISVQPVFPVVKGECSGSQVPPQLILFLYETKLD